MNTTDKDREEARYWCSEGCGFVDANHRCEQLGRVYVIPAQAVARIRAEAAEEAAKAERANIEAEIADAGTSCRWCHDNTAEEAARKERERCAKEFELWYRNPLNGNWRKFREQISSGSYSLVSEPKTPAPCTECPTNPGPDINADDSACIECARQCPNDCPTDKPASPRHALAEDVAMVQKALNRYALKSNYNDDDVGECQAEEALAAFDRIAGKLG